ncbi:MAG TPA: hypothetical protein VHE35_27625 [Kofleriaceae bacterium]|nr:hypothetical protein [Kofleriaceae bacterium]
MAPATLLCVLAGPAAAGPRHKKPPAPRKDELAAAVATGDPVAACKAAIAAAQAGDLARASLVVPACDPAVTTVPALAADARRARIAISHAASAQGWSPVEVVVRPAAAVATVTVDAFPGLPVAVGRHLLPAGHYRFTAHGAQGDVGYDLALDADSRALVLLDVPPPPAAAGNGVLDFTDGEPTATVAGPPPKIDHGSLLPERFRRGLGKTPPKP